jgi:hypothetical protein
VYKEQGWCGGGSVQEEWTSGAHFKHPELACCACGGGSKGGGGGSACEDTAGWTNGAGPGCRLYEAERWCKGGEVLEGWTTGAAWNSPETNCCACGKA